MQEGSSKMQDNINSSKIIDKLIQNENEIDFLKYFSDNGFKNCEYLESTDLTIKNTKRESIKAYDKKLKKSVVIRIITTLQPELICSRINEVQKIDSKFIQKYLYPAKIIHTIYVYYVKEFKQSGNLKSLYTKKLFNIDFVQRFVSKMLIGMDQIHKNNLYHGRIKLENVVLESNNQILLNDYCFTQEDGFLLVEESKQNENNLEINESSNSELQQANILKRQNLDLFRMGIAITCLCDELRDKEKDLIEIVRYNTKRSYKLISIANTMMRDNAIEQFRLNDILTQLNYFEGTYSTFYLGAQKYEGGIVDNKKHGRGVCEYVYGDILFGTWKNDKYQNDGVLYYSYGDLVDRGFSEEERQNSVEIWKKEQAIYEGTLEDTWMNGTGKYTRNETVQVGTFKQGKLNGYCEIYYPSHDIFKGNLVEHKKTGYGEMFWDCQQVYKGDFLNDLVSGTGEYQFADGSEYYGETKNGLFDGFGKFYWTYGQNYEGQWVKHQRTGIGRFYQSTLNEVYEGMFKLNLQHGKGKLTRGDGTVLYGIWENNVYKQGSDKLVNSKELDQVFKKYKDSILKKGKQQQCTIF